MVEAAPAEAIAFDTTAAASGLAGSRPLDLRLGNQYADISFPTPLPEGLRYCVRLIGVRDMAGNLLDQGSGSLDLATLVGDVTGDMQVTVNDAGAIGTLLGTAVVDQADPYQVRADVNRDGTINMLDAMLVVTHIGMDFRGSINPCSDLGGNFRSDEESDGGRGGASRGDPTVAQAGRAPGTSGGTVTTGTGGTGGTGARGDRSGEPAFGSALVTLGLADGKPELGRLRLDVVAVRSDDAEHLEQIASAYMLELSDSSEPDAILEGWRIATVPQASRSEIALSSLAVLLGGDAVECAGIVQRIDDSMVAVTPHVEAQRRTSIPASWIERVLEANFASTPFVAESGGLYSFDLGDAFIPEISRLTGALAKRKEFSSVRAATVLLHAGTARAGTGSVTPAEGQPTETEVKP